MACELNMSKRTFSMRHLKITGFGVALVAAFVPNLASAVSIYYKGVGYCTDWEGSLESCNAWSRWSENIVCFPDGAYPTQSGNGTTVIERNVRGEITVVLGRDRFQYVILSAKGKKALEGIGRGGSRLAVEKAFTQAYASSIRTIPAPKLKALTSRYKARVVNVGRK